MCTTTCTCGRTTGDESDPEPDCEVKKANKVVEITKVSDQDPQTGKVAFGKSVTAQGLLHPQEA
jgi:hypothetical protein